MDAMIRLQRSGIQLQALADGSIVLTQGKAVVMLPGRGEECREFLDAIEWLNRGLVIEETRLAHYEAVRQRDEMKCKDGEGCGGPRV
jgi:hypothetical protein